jgi:MFS family permease
MGFGMSRLLWASLLMVLLAGLGMIVAMAATNTILQTISDEDKRGRVMSFFSMAFLGMTPFGSLFAGAVAAQIGAPWTVIAGGIVCLAAAAVFAIQLPNLRSLVRPIYVRQGILPEVAAGMQAAAQLTTPPHQ